MPTRILHLFIAIGLFVTEVLIATKLSHIAFIRAYLGDFLAVILLYHFAKVFREFSPKPLALGVFAFSVGLEIAQYLHLADALGLPHNSILRILIGSHFSWLDILMYALGCGTAYLIDSRLLHRKRGF